MHEYQNISYKKKRKSNSNFPGELDSHLIQMNSKQINNYSETRSGIIP